MNEQVILSEDPSCSYFVLVLIWVGISISNMNEEHL